MKRKLLLLYKNILNILFHFFIQHSFCSINREKSVEYLKSRGYPFSPLWDKISPLTSHVVYDMSIIIPVYNSELFLEKCLCSILSQKTTYSYEVICINDGSNDNSLGILHKFANQYPDKMKVYSQDNQGISKTRNRGIELSLGKYISFLDNDDTVSENYVQRILDRAKDTSALFIQTAYNIVDCSGNVLSCVSHGNKVIDVKVEDDIINEAQGYIWGGALHRSVFELVRFPVGFWYEDMINKLVVVRLAGRIATIGMPLYNYLIHNNNTSKTIWYSDSVKPVDQVWLAIQLSKYSLETLKLPISEVFYVQLLIEFTDMLYYRMATMSRKTRKMAFCLAASYLKSINYEYVGKKTYLKRSERALKDNNYYAWLFNVKSGCSY